MKKQVKSVLSLALIAGAVAVSHAASAQDLGASVNTIKSNIASIPNLISGVCYIIGAGLVGAGLLKLKAYSENPGQTPIGQGLGRVAIGTTLLASPAMTGWISTTINTSGTAITASGLSALN